jgi:hypothetical protein
MVYDVFIDANHFRRCAAQDLADRGIERHARGLRPDAGALLRACRALARDERALNGLRLGRIRFYEGTLPPYPPRGISQERDPDARVRQQARYRAMRLEEGGYHNFLRSRRIIVRTAMLRETPDELTGHVKTAVTDKARERVPAIQRRLAELNARYPRWRESQIDSLLTLDLLALAETAADSRRHVVLLMSNDGGFAPVIECVKARWGTDVALLRPPRQGFRDSGPLKAAARAAAGPGGTWKIRFGDQAFFAAYALRNSG